MGLKMILRVRAGAVHKQQHTQPILNPCEACQAFLLLRAV